MAPCEKIFAKHVICQGFYPEFAEIPPTLSKHSAREGPELWAPAHGFRTQEASEEF